MVLDVLGVRICDERLVRRSRGGIVYLADSRSSAGGYTTRSREHGDSG